MLRSNMGFPWLVTLSNRMVHNKSKTPHDRDVIWHHNNEQQIFWITVTQLARHQNYAGFDELGLWTSQRKAIWYYTYNSVEEFWRDPAFVYIALRCEVQKKTTTVKKQFSAWEMEVKFNVQAIYIHFIRNIIVDILSSVAFYNTTEI